MRELGTGQLGKLGNPPFGVELEPIDFVKMAEACGVRALRIEDPKAAFGKLQEALAVPGPCLVEAVVDPYEPPFPSSFDLAEATNIATALARGAADRGKIARTIAEDVVRELIWRRDGGRGGSARSCRSPPRGR